MTVLIPMSPTAYEGFLGAAVHSYAEENVKAGRWPAAQALAQSRREYDTLLPAGLATPDHYLFEIRAQADAPTLGSIWFAIVERAGSRHAFVYDVVIHPEHRRQGHAMRAFAALEPIVRGLGVGSIGLHVFGHNPGAQALYQRLGYQVTGINMLKRLDGPVAGAS